VFKKS